MLGPQQNLGPIGSAVLTFIGYKHINRQTNKQIIYIDSDGGTQGYIVYRPMFVFLKSTTNLKQC